jgi:hypothetical protein
MCGKAWCFRIPSFLNMLGAVLVSWPLWVSLVYYPLLLLHGLAYGNSFRTGHASGQDARLGARRIVSCAQHTMIAFRDGNRTGSSASRNCRDGTLPTRESCQSQHDCEPFVLQDAETDISSAQHSFIHCGMRFRSCGYCDCIPLKYITVFHEGGAIYMFACR